MRKAYELNPYDLSMAAAYGYGLIFSGNYKNGTPILQHAVEASSAHPTWWDYGLFLGKLHARRHEQGSARQRGVGAPTKPRTIWRRACRGQGRRKRRRQSPNCCKSWSQSFRNSPPIRAAVFRERPTIRRI